MIFAFTAPIIAFLVYNKNVLTRKIVACLELSWINRFSQCQSPKSGKLHICYNFSNLVLTYYQRLLLNL